MSSQISSRAVLYGVALLLTACRRTASDPFADDGKAAERIDCAVGGVSAFAQVCAIERADGPDGLVLTLRHPDGGFRRIDVTRDGRGVATADGAEPATVAVSGDHVIEVAIGGDRYRLPATVKP